jgi:hypothetical protein
LELIFPSEGLEKLRASSRVGAQNHPFALIGADDSLIDHFPENLIGRIKQGFKSCGTFITQAWKHDNQTTASSQFPGTQRKKKSPVIGCLKVECCTHLARASYRREMSWNQRWNMAEPDGSVRTPSEINLFSRKDVLIE